jgi:broad specificity phosphatase PhoE
VFVRAVESLRVLTKEANSANGSVVAVAHSTFLRILIAMVLNEPLAEAGSRKIANGSVSVLDIRKDFQCQTIGPKSSLVGGKLSLAPDDFSLDIPICDVVRVNESRHLPSI